MSTPPVLQYATPTPPSLAKRTTRGFVWLTIQTLSSKVVSLAARLILVHILDPDDFGLVAMAYAVTSVPGFLKDTGLREILVKRQRHFGRWANAAFWMSLALGILAALVIAAIAPFAPLFYPKITASQAEILPRIILVVAAAMPIEALWIIPTARLQADIRFKAIASVGMLTNLLSMTLNVLLACLDFGIYSFVLPRPFVAVLQAIILWSLAGTRVDFRLHFRRWRFLIVDSGLLMANSACNTLVMQGDNFILGSWYAPQIVGVYSVAYGFAAQTIQIFTSNLQGALFPALVKIHDNPVHQTNSYIRVSLFCGSVGAFLCFLQAALAPWLVQLLLKPEWHDTTPIIQLMSLNMAIALAGGSTPSLFQAQGRFLTQFLWSLAVAVVFLTLVIIGAWFSAAIGVTFAVCTMSALMVPIGVYIAIRPGGGTWRDVTRLMFIPLGSATAAFLPPVLVLYALHVNAASLAYAIPVTLISSALYALFLHLSAPGVWRDGLARLTDILVRR